MEMRAYRPGDEPGIIAVIRGVFEEKGWPWDELSENRDVTAIAEFYLHPGGGFWVLENEGTIIGTVALRRKDEHRCVLYRLYLPKEWRGQGLGKRLYRHAIEQARASGYNEMEIWSDKTLDVSHVMYKASGAESLGDREVFDEAYGFPYAEWGYLLKL